MQPNQKLGFFGFIIVLIVVTFITLYHMLRSFMYGIYEAIIVLPIAYITGVDDLIREELDLKD